MLKDIHGYDQTLDSLARAIQNSTLSEANKKLLLDYDRAMLLIERLGKPRRIRLLSLIFYLARNTFKGDLKAVTIEDIKDCLRDLETKGLSPWTISLYRVSIKKFYKWVAYGDDYAMTKDVPDLVKWIKIHVKKKDQPKVQASAILTEDEVRRLIDSAQLPRDRAFISMLYELGSRISEIGMMKIGDLSRDAYSYITDLSGKTGHRTPRIVMSDPYLTEWLNHHPLKGDPSAPLWVCEYRKGDWKQMNYDTLRAVLLRLKQKAGIKKRLYAHLFRHTRVTHLLGRKLMNEAQAKVYFGWTPDSKMIADYAHLVSQDANDAVLQMYGIKTTDTPRKPEAKPCPRCQRVNAVDATFCVQCSSILDPSVAFKQDEAQSGRDDVLNALLQDEHVRQAILSRLTDLDADALTRGLKAMRDSAEVYKAFKATQPSTLHG